MAVSNKSSFEELLAELEEIVKMMESGEVGLEDSIKQYEKGVKLFKKCESMLLNSEKKIQELTKELKQNKMNDV